MEFITYDDEMLNEVPTGNLAQTSCFAMSESNFRLKPDNKFVHKIKPERDSVAFVMASRGSPCASDANGTSTGSRMLQGPPGSLANAATPDQSDLVRTKP